jgi:SAM-dependent methyltransferase
MANEGEIRRWNDPAWTSAWPAREVMTTSVTPYLMAAVSPQPGQRVLDVGCGGGGVAVSLAARTAPDGIVVGVDISEKLLELARTRAAEAGVRNLEFVHSDMQTDTVGEGDFDLAVSQFGVMFFDRPVLAFANIGRHLRHGGQLTFVCWQMVDRNPWHVSSALAGLIPAPKPPDAGRSAVGPFTLGEPGHTTDLLTEAGFVEIAIESRQITVIGPASAVFDRGLLEFMGVAPEHLVEAEAVVDRHLDQFALGEDRYEYPLAFHVVTSRWP